MNGEESNQTNQTNKERDDAFYIMVIGSSIMLATALLCGIYFFMQLHKIDTVRDVEYQVYGKHYVMITEKDEEEFWSEVYEGAQQAAEQNDIYLERLGESLALDYSVNDLLRMAINSSVDGIIVSTAENEQTQKLINQAVEQGIFVATIRKDIDNTARQTFVGVNQYELGMTFGKEIVKVMKEDALEVKRIFLLMDTIESESRQNSIAMAIRDAIGQEIDEEHLPDIHIKLIDTSDTFSAEENIRDIFLKEEELPDVIVCLNSTYTKCCYQALVDYNRVGEIKIIGYFASDDILEAIEKRIIFSTIKVEADNMGRRCIEAMKEYEDTGYTNSYIPVEIQVIGTKEAKEMLHDQERIAQ